MATLIFSAIGTVLGGPLGGAIGALAGRQIDAALIGGGTREGPRLAELTVSTSSYGTPIPRHHGRMRAPGSIIWATDLVEHSHREGGGKGRPSVTTHTYTASFAVALSSRPILGVGRIWADGNLLRGEAGDLKAGGTLRVHPGGHDQMPDPLIAQVEGIDRCPAFRGLAYAVFEDLELAMFFNRLPALTFEIIADDGPVALQTVVGELLEGAETGTLPAAITGLSCEGPLAEVLATLAPVLPMDCDAAGGALAIARNEATAPVVLPEATMSGDDDSFGAASGHARSRSPAPPAPPAILRYYDTGRDYLPGAQQAPGRATAGQPRTLDLPVALDAATAQALVAATTRRTAWARETLAWRCATLDPAIRPGVVVTLPGAGSATGPDRWRQGRWKVEDWEWRADGVELSLARMPPAPTETGAAAVTDGGRFLPAPDLAPSPTRLVAFELPWDGIGTGDAPLPHAAVSSASAGWTGAALFADRGDGALASLGSSGRTRAIIGAMVDAMPAANPLLLDRESTLVVDLVDPAMTLADATIAALAGGANRALAGAEIVQFLRARPLGGKRWQLSGLLRGRGGTEAAVHGHQAGEPFVLLDGRIVPLDPVAVGSDPGATILAAGLADAEPVPSGIALSGIARQPLSPVHPRATWREDGGLDLAWTRRARGAWTWTDAVDVPLREQVEAYVVGFGPAAAPVARWTVDRPRLTLSADVLSDLHARLPGGRLHVRQQGTHALSAPLMLATVS